MKFERLSPRAVEAFDAVVPPPPVERRKMFGTPVCFVRGNMFAGAYGQSIMLRLPEAEREKVLRAGGAPFAPMGRAMREYVTLPAAYLDDAARLRRWMKKAQAFAESLPAKEPKRRKAASRPRAAGRG